MRNIFIIIFYFFILFEICSQTNESKKGTLYLSWGYNKEWYSNSNIKVVQAELGNNFTFNHVKGKDKPGWNTGIFNKPLTIPQYNYRLGYFLSNKWLIELNFDHTKFIVPDQKLHLTGRINYLNVDTFINRDNEILSYQLNNGANFFLLNVGYDCAISKLSTTKIKHSVIFKAGAGILVPHVQNTILGHENSPAFQFGGLDIGLECVWKTTIYKFFYLEYAVKTVYADYNQLKVYKGKASQNFICLEMILNLGIQIPTWHSIK